MSDGGAAFILIIQDKKAEVYREEKKQPLFFVLPEEGPWRWECGIIVAARGLAGFYEGSRRRNSAGMEG